jgi:hypothetical protein
MLRTLRLSWWYTPVIARFRGLTQENNEFEASLSYIVRSCHRNKKGAPLT